MFAPIPVNGTVSIKVFLRNLQDGEIWTGIFAGSTMDSQGMVIAIPSGDVRKRSFIQKSIPGETEIQQSQTFEQSSPLYDILFEISNGSVRTVLMNNSAAFDPLSLPSTQLWLFVGYQVKQGNNRIDADFLELVVQEQ
jgi:hypothetical protein